MFGIDDHGNAQTLFDKPDFLAVHRVSDPGNGVTFADFFCNQAAEKIQFVRTSHSDQDIGSLNAGIQ